MEKSNYKIDNELKEKYNKLYKNTISETVSTLKKKEKTLEEYKSQEKKNITKYKSQRKAKR